MYFSKALFEGLIFGGAYIRRGLSTEGNLRFKIGRASLIVGSKGLYLEGQLNGGCFALPFGGGGLIFGGAYTRHKYPALATRSLLSFFILSSTLLRAVEVWKSLTK